jgi:hypothetical protein
MRRLSALAMLVVVLAGFGLLSCDTLKTADVTLDIAGDPYSAFTGYYETTGAGRVAISGIVPKSYTFQARKSLDVVAAQIVRVGLGELTARIVADGTTRDSAATSGVIGTVTLEWLVK